MITTTDYDDKYVFIKSELNSLGNLWKTPIRCNHLVIHYLMEGEIKFELNYTDYTAKACSFVLFSPLDIVIMKECSRNYKATTLVLPMSLASSTNKLPQFDFDFYDKLKSSPVTQLFGKEQDMANKLFDMLKTANETFEYKEFEESALSVTNIIFQLYINHFKKYASYYGVKTYESRKRSLFKKFVRGLVAASNKSREVLYYANELGVSSGYLNEVCNEVSNYSAKEIIDTAVVSRLKYELSYTDKSIQELADEYNFPSQSYLSRYYKRMTGMSPSEFRRNRDKEA